jgi:hypothetical protein
MSSGKNRGSKKEKEKERRRGRKGNTPSFWALESGGHRGTYRREERVVRGTSYTWKSHKLSYMHGKRPASESMARGHQLHEGGRRSGGGRCRGPSTVESHPKDWPVHLRCPFASKRARTTSKCPFWGQFTISSPFSLLSSSSCLF